MTKAIARLVLANAGVAIAIWLLPASVHIVGWPSSGPVRLAFLAPLSRLWMAMLIMSGVSAAAAYAWHRTGRSLVALADACLPLAILLVWAVPFLPWLPDRAPLLLIFAGPLRWVVAAIAIGGAVRAPLGRLWSRLVPHLVPARIVVFALSFALYTAFGLRNAAEVGFGGDEPHYLIITHSLLADRDLDIANNHAQRDYRAFYGGELRPDFLQRGTHGEIYSIHAPGLPAMLVPSYAAAGARGAVVFMALLGALAALAIFDVAAAVADRRVATVIWIAVAFSIPFVPHAWLIYPEIPGALVVAWTALWLLRPAPSPLDCARSGLSEVERPATRAALHGTALAVLPWLHTKFAVLLAFLTLFELVRLFPRVKAMAALVAPIAVSGAAWLYSFYRMYGVFDPQAPYGSYTGTFLLARNIPRGMLGLLIDQKFGLLVYSPVYVLAAAGAWIMLRDPRRRAYAIAMLVTAGAFVVSTTRLYMWWGGSSAPARFLVPIVPVLAPLVAVALAELRSVGARAIAVSTVVLSIAIAVTTVTSPREALLYSDPHGLASLVTALQGSAPLDVSLPTFTEEHWRAPIAILVPWLLALAIVIAATVSWRGRTRSIFWTAACQSLGFVIAGSMLAAFRTPPERAAVITRGQLAAIHDYDPARLRAVDATHAKRLDAKETLDALMLSIRRPIDLAVDNPRILAGPFELPPGRYEARLSLETARPLDGEAFVALSDQIALAQTSGPLSNSVTLPFDAKVFAPVFVGVSDAVAARAVRRVDIAPVALVPRSARDGARSRGIEPIGGDVPSFMAYVDGETYPEGGVFWTRGTATGSVVIVTAGASALRLILHVGPTGGPVTVDAGSQRSTVDLNPDETRELSIPIPAGAETMAVSVRAGRAFRPAEVDPQSDDQRRLGCQVRPLLSR